MVVVAAWWFYHSFNWYVDVQWNNSLLSREGKGGGGETCCLRSCVVCFSPFLRRTFIDLR